MKKATELYKGLIDLGVEAAEANSIVASKVEKGELVNDLDAVEVAKSDDLSADMVKAAGAALAELIKGDGMMFSGKGKDEKEAAMLMQDAEKKAMMMAKEEEKEKEAAMKLAAMDEDEKDSDEDEEEEDDAAKSQHSDSIVAFLTKGSDAILKSTREANVVLAKTMQAQGRLLESLVKGYNDLHTTNSVLVEQNNRLLSALNQPVVKSVQSNVEVEVQPAPGEVIAKGGESYETLYAKVVDLAKARIMDNPNDVNVAKGMVTAMSMLTSGGDPRDVARKFGLSLD